MKSINEDPRVKHDQDKQRSAAGAKSTGQAESKALSDRERSRFYKNGEPEIEGPNYNKKSEGADGDTSENAGIFK